VGCIHRNVDECKLTNSQCFGLVYDGRIEDYVVDPWKESLCGSFKSDGQDEEVSSKTEWNLKEGDKYKVVVRIFGSKGDTCDDGTCLTQEYRTAEEDAEILESLLNRRYVGGIKVEGISLNSPRMAEFPEIKEMIDKGVELPIATINGEVKFIGDIPLNLLKLEIERLGLQPR
jgi:hypothetical protein